ncbi:MAG: DUF5652 family protein [Patescibacteria group bacterium]
MNNFNATFGMGAGAPAWIHVFGPALLLLILWSLFWKGLALWHSGRRGQEYWFVVMLLVNTAGVLEIVYLFLIIKLKVAQLFSKIS